MIRTEKLDDVTILVVDMARLDATTATAFHAQASPVIREATKVVMDFSAVEFMDSTGIGALVGVTKAIAPGGRIAMCGLSPAVETIFKLLRMDMFFIVAEDRAGAAARLETV